MCLNGCVRGCLSLTVGGMGFIPERLMMMMMMMMMKKRTLTPKSMPLTGDEHAKLKTHKRKKERKT